MIALLNHLIFAIRKNTQLQFGETDSFLMILGQKWSFLPCSFAVIWSSYPFYTVIWSSEILVWNSEKISWFEAAIKLNWVLMTVLMILGRILAFFNQVLCCLVALLSHSHCHMIEGCFSMEFSKDKLIWNSNQVQFWGKDSFNDFRAKVGLFEPGPLSRVNVLSPLHCHII